MGTEIIILFKKSFFSIIANSFSTIINLYIRAEICIVLQSVFAIDILYYNSSVVKNFWSTYKKPICFWHLGLHPSYINL